ncbi:hypothetical protein [Streptomyces sp. NBC_01304]|uniref:hypothetical protein n=1 Tax=Streptomyces sp. NBC_01304 TaxID=2903818 RepID=UPI002E110B5C|nr:hypothetical protein OG430_44605 [Streptomyces sp. NBC_01304]
MNPVYNVIFSEQAARIRDSLPAERQELLTRGLATLSRDPRTKVSSPIGGDENTRSVALTHTLALEYVISDGLLIVLVVHIVDTSHVLIDDEDRQPA